MSQLLLLCFFSPQTFDLQNFPAMWWQTPKVVDYHLLSSTHYYYPLNYITCESSLLVLFARMQGRYIWLFLLSTFWNAQRRMRVSSFVLPRRPFPSKKTTTQKRGLQSTSGASPADNADSLSNNNPAWIPLKIVENVPEHCRVKPSREYYRKLPVLKSVARWSWRRRHFVLKVLHWKDPWTPVDSCINLECLWWKALSTINPQSPCYEPFTYDVLPRPGRTMLKATRRLHPRWIHALLEIRMAYLNRAIAQEIQYCATASSNDYEGVRLITLGAGYDTRSIRMLNAAETRIHSTADDAKPTSLPVTECWEFDLPSSMEAKQQLIENRLLPRQRRRRIQMGHSDDDLKLPTLVGLDLNDTDAFKKKLYKILGDDNGKHLYTVFVVEGVLMYLEPDKAKAILECCAQATTESSSLCFADRLFENFEVTPEPIQSGLKELGWELTEWAPAPNANAKHMGIARSIR